MPSDLDCALDAAMDQLTAPGGLLETVTVASDGVAYTGFRHAPPSLPAFFAQYCTRHADLEFIVEDDLRLTFAQVHDAGTARGAGPDRAATGSSLATGSGSPRAIRPTGSCSTWRC